MQLVRQRGARSVGALFLLALLSLPLALSGHHHQLDDLSVGRTGCAICAVTAHAPVLSSPALPALELPLLGAIAAPPAPAPAARVALRTRAPRAPPTSGTIVA